MLITRASRHDFADVQELLATRGDEAEVDLKRGKAFIARDGKVVGCVRMIEVEPQTIVVDDVLVADDRRGSGIGSQLMQGAMNNQGGKLFLCCHEDRIAFYERLGFSLLPNGFDDAPPTAQEYWREAGDYPTAPDHEHFFMTAR